MIRTGFLIFLFFFAGCVSSSWVDTPVTSQEGEEEIVSDARSVLPMTSILIFPVQIPVSSQEIGMKFQAKVHAALLERFREVPGLKIESLPSIPEGVSLRFEDPSFWQEQGQRYQADGILVIINQSLYKPSAGAKVIEYLILTGQGNPQAAWRVLLFSSETGKKVWDRPFIGGVSSLSGIGIIASSIEDTLSPIAKAIAKSWPLDPDQWTLGEQGWVGPYFEQDYYLKKGIAAAGVSEQKITLDPTKYLKNQFPVSTKDFQYTIKFHKSEKHQFVIQWFAPSGQKIQEHEMKMTGWDMGLEIDFLHLDKMKPEDKEGFWTVKLWEGEKLIDHRRFLIGRAVRPVQPDSAQMNLADQSQIQEERHKTAQRQEPNEENFQTASQGIPASKVEPDLLLASVPTQDDDVLVRAKAALERAKRMGTTAR